MQPVPDLGRIRVIPPRRVLSEVYESLKSLRVHHDADRTDQRDHDIELIVILDQFLTRLQEG